MKKLLQIGVVGSAGASEYPKGAGIKIKSLEMAEEVGSYLAKRNTIVITGGKGGVMEAAARGAKQNGGITIGVISGNKRFRSNRYTDIEVLSGAKAVGLDECLLAWMCDGLIVIGGGAGTLQEITIAYRNKIPVVALKSEEGWGKKLAGKYIDKRNTQLVWIARTPKQAVEKILDLIHHRSAL